MHFAKASETFTSALYTIVFSLRTMRDANMHITTRDVCCVCVFVCILLYTIEIIERKGSKLNS